MKHFILSLFTFMGLLAYGQNKSWGKSYTIKHYYENGKLVKADTIIQENQNGSMIIGSDFGLIMDTDSLQNGWIFDGDHDMFLWNDVDAMPSFATDSLMIIHRDMIKKNRYKMKQLEKKFRKKFKDAHEAHKDKSLKFFFDGGGLHRLDLMEEKFQNDTLLQKKLEHLEQKLEALQKRFDEEKVQKT